ncbi:MAG: DNA polymerase III gamma/tau subunit [Cyclobacteriaceae bacterium]|jgi:DNA polymerase III gamma/tau subunit
MQAATISLLKKALKDQDQQELIELCLRLAKYKKESKELLSYLLFDAEDPDSYVTAIKLEMDDAFEEINTSSYYFIKKSLRKILRELKKHIRFTLSKKVEVELLMYWCQKIRHMTPPYKGSNALENLYDRQLVLTRKALATLDDDLQFDYEEEIKRVLEA